MADETKTPQEILAAAIERSGATNEQVAKATYGETDEVMVAKFRRGNDGEPLPPWHTFSKLLTSCMLSPSDIGQPLPPADPNKVYWS